MKKFVILSVGIVSVIMLFFAAELLSEKKDTKITAFNSSLTMETKKEYAKAIEELTKIYETESKDYLVNLRLGWLNYCVADYKQSKVYYAKALEIDGSSIEAMLASTLPMAALKEWTNVKKVYQNVLEIDPQNYTANLRLGQSYFYAQDYKASAKHLELVKSHFPGDYEANSSLAWTYYYLGKKSAARDLFISTLMVSPKDSLATVGLKLVN